MDMDWSNILLIKQDCKLPLLKGQYRLHPLKVNEFRQANGVSPIQWIDPVIIRGVTRVKRFIEMRFNKPSEKFKTDFYASR